MDGGVGDAGGWETGTGGGGGGTAECPCGAQYPAVDGDGAKNGDVGGDVPIMDDVIWWCLW